MAAEFEVEGNDQGEFYWHLRGANGEIVCVSEGFTREEDAWRAAERVPAIASEAAMSLPSS